MTQDPTFLGRGWAFPPEFSEADGSVLMVSAEEDIRQSLIILLSTRLGERIMQPRYGCNLQGFVFESTDISTLTFLRDTIETAILYHEPRIVLEGIELADRTGREGVVLLDIRYTIIATNTRFNLVYPFYIREATHLLLNDR